MPFATAQDAESFLDQGRKKKFKDLGEASAFLDEEPAATAPPRAGSAAPAGGPKFKSAQDASDFLDSEDGQDETETANTGRKVVDYVKSLVSFKRPEAAAAMTPSPVAGSNPMDPTGGRDSFSAALPPISTPAPGAEAAAAAPDIKPGSAMDFYKRGLAPFLDHRPDLALPIWEEGLKNNPNDPILKRDVERLRQTMPKGLQVKDASMQKYVQGLGAYGKGDYEGMNQAFQEAQDADPKNPWIKNAMQHIVPEDQRADLQDQGEPESSPIHDFLAKLAPGAAKAAKSFFPAPDVTKAPTSVEGALKTALAPALAPSAPIRSPEGQRLVGAAGAGVAGAAGSIAAAEPAAEAFLGKDTRFGRKAQAVSRYLKKVSDDVMPHDPTFAEHLASGAGSMALFMVPGGLVAKSLELIPATAHMAIALAPAIETGVSTILQAGSNAGGVYQDLIDKGVNRRRAGEAAFKDFWTTAIVVGLTNKFGVLSDKLQGVKKMVASVPLQGIQQAAQDILAEVSKAKAEERPVAINWPQIAQSAGIGAALGLGMSGMEAIGGGGHDGPKTHVSEVLGEQGQAYIANKFPALAEAVADKEFPLTYEKVQGIISNAVGVGEEVLLKGGDRNAAQAAAVKDFSLNAAKELDAAKPPAPASGEDALKKAVTDAGADWVGVQKVRQPGKEDLVLFNDPDTHTTLALPMSQATPENIRARVEGRPAGPTAPEAKAPIEQLVRQFAPEEPPREVTDQDVDRYAGVLHQRDLADRSTKTGSIERFIAENGGIAPYRKNAFGVKEESEEYRDIPVRLRGKVPYDEMTSMLQDAHLLPPDASYSELYSAINRIPKRGEMPKLADFREQARHELENNPDLAIDTPPPQNRTMLKRSFREAFGLRDEQAGAAADVADAWATQWAKDTGRPKEDWYKTRVADVRQSYSLPGEEDTLFQGGDKAAPPFYSTLQKVLRDKMPERAPVEQVRNILKSQDLRREEVDWSGVEDFLKDKKTVTRPELMNFLRDNEVKVQEVVKGMEFSPEKKAKIDEFNQREQKILDLRDYGGQISHDEANRRVKQLREEMGLSAHDVSSIARTTGDTKYSNYVTPGGKNYKELLLTLPPKGEITHYRVVDGKDVPVREGGKDFPSPHSFEEPNILAHVRFNERTDAQGRKVLFLEEIQSDWHQKGRKVGYSTGKGTTDALFSDALAATKKNDNFGYDYASEFLRDAANEDDWTKTWEPPKSEAERKAIQDYVDAAKEEIDNKNKVPDAPFKKTWHELAMKRIMRWAAEHDFDKVAWTTGDQQADRYDLSKQVDWVEWNGDRLVAGKGDRASKDTENLIEQDVQDEKKLADYIGKDAAEKLVQKRRENPGRTAVISGVDLKVGGEGMRGFYDKILPDFVNKYTKKWGGRVGESEIKTQDMDFSGFDAQHRKAYPEATDSDIQKAYDRFTRPEKVHSLDITPAMKDAVLEGQPLFQRGGAPGAAKGAVEFMDDFRGIIHAFAQADISTAFHETAHIFRRDLYRRVEEARAGVKGELQGHIQALENWVGAKDGVWTEAHEEKFARAFERYMAEGKAPTPKLVAVFQKAKEWLAGIYQSIKGSKIDVDLTPKVRETFDRMLGGKKAELNDLTPGVKSGGPRVLKQEGEGTIGQEGEWEPRPADEAEVQKMFEEGKRAGELFAEPAKNATRHPPKEVLEAMLDPGAKMKDLTLFETFQVPKEAKEGEEPGVVTLPLFGQAGETSTLAPIRAMEAMDGKRFGIMKRNFLFPIHDADMAFQTELAAKKDQVADAFKGMSKADKEMVFDVVENKERLKEIWPPKNAEKILGAAKFLQEEYDNLLNRLNVARAAIGKDPIKRRSNYITHYQELSAIQDIAKMVGLNMVDVPASMLSISAMTKPNSPYFRFAKRRLGEKTERDAFKAYSTYLEPALRTIHFSQAIKNGRDILEYKVRIPGEYEGATESGKVDERSLFGIRYPNAYNYLNNYLNRLAGKRDIVDRTFPVAASIVGVTNRLFSAGSIGGNLSSVLTQPASIRNAASETGIFSIPGYMSILTPKWKAFYEENSRIAKGRSYEPATRGERLLGSKTLASLHDAAASALSIPVGVADGIMTGGAYLSGYFKAKSMGLSREDAMRYADDVAERSQASANQVDRPPVNAGKIKSALGQFQTFVYNEWSQLKNDMVKKSIEGENSKQGYADSGLASIREGRGVGLRRLGTYIAVSAALSQVYDSLGLPNPMKLDGATMPFIQTPATNWMWQHTVNQVPGISAARFGGSPFVKGAWNGMVYMAGTDQDKQKALHNLKSLGFRLIPGGGQISKTLSGQAVAATTNDTWKAAKALMFGAHQYGDSDNKSQKIKKKRNPNKRRKTR